MLRASQTELKGPLRGVTGGGGNFVEKKRYIIFERPLTQLCVVEQKVPQILNICFSHSLTPSYTARDRSHMMSSLGQGGRGGGSGGG